MNLYVLKLLVTARNFIEEIRVLFRFYPSIRFLKIDSALRLSYAFKSPFKVSKKFLQERGEEEIYAYGETPLTTLATIAEVAELKKADKVFELGCGRGRGCFWLENFIGCRVVGIDFVPTFIQKAEKIRQRFNLSRIEFRCEDLAVSDFTAATAIYLYGTCYDDAFIQMLIRKFTKLPPGTKIITVSYPLSDYTELPLFKVAKQFSVPFTWGNADVFLNVRVESHNLL